MITQLHNLTNLHASTDPHDLVMGNVHFVSGLLERCFRRDEIPIAALFSYYVDYYLAQVNNGGTSQFVYNSEWDTEVVSLVREGLAAIGAERHGQIFAELESLVAGVDPSENNTFLSGGYFGSPIPERDRYHDLDTQFYALSDEENLTVLNHAFLCTHPAILIEPDTWEDTLDRMAEALPDLAEREAAAIAAEEEARSPEELAIRALCPQLGSDFDSITAISPQEQDGVVVMEWHFVLEDGRYFSALFRKGEVSILSEDGPVVIRAPFISEDDVGAPDDAVDAPAAGDGDPLFERQPDAVRPGPYCDETSTEVVTQVSKERLMAWLEARLGPLIAIDEDQQDYRATTEAGWTIVHVVVDPDMTYLGVEDTPACWPSSLALAQDLADTMRSLVMVLDSQATQVQPR